MSTFTNSVIRLVDAIVTGVGIDIVTSQRRNDSTVELSRASQSSAPDWMISFGAAIRSAIVSQKTHDQNSRST